MAKSSSQWTGELDELLDRAVFTFEGTRYHLYLFIYKNFKMVIIIQEGGIILHVQLTVEL